MPTSATRISAVRTSSRSFPGSSLWNNGNSSPPLAWISAGRAYPPANSRTPPGARFREGAIATATFSAKCTVAQARACQAFSCSQRKKPIAPHGCKSCYRGPGTSFLGACLPSPAPFRARRGPLEIDRVEIDRVPERALAQFQSGFLGPIWGGCRNCVPS